MQPLNLPDYSFQLETRQGQPCIFDPVRKKFLVLTPEEWVRQNFVQFLIQEKKYPASLIGIEVGLKYNALRKRADVLIYSSAAEPLLLVECKAPSVKISQDTFDQIARYNMQFKVKYLVVTNGLDHYCCEMEYDGPSYRFLKEIPSYQ